MFFLRFKFFCFLFLIHFAFDGRAICQIIETFVFGLKFSFFSLRHFIVSSSNAIHSLLSQINIVFNTQVIHGRKMREMRRHDIISIIFVWTAVFLISAWIFCHLKWISDSRTTSFAVFCNVYLVAIAVRRLKIFRWIYRFISLSDEWIHVRLRFWTANWRHAKNALHVCLPMTHSTKRTNFERFNVEKLSFPSVRTHHFVRQ